ncbi:MAG: glycosyltransferase [Gemmatimonadaceae bacterium]
MRVAVVNLTSGGLSGGYKKYLQAVLPLLRASPLVSDVNLMSPRGMRLPSDFGDQCWFWPTHDALLGYRGLKAELRRRAPDVVFIPTARIVKTGFPTVTMVRNMEPLIAPFAGNSATDALKNIARALTARMSSIRAERVIAVSPFVRDFLVDRWAIPADKIGVVSHGVEAPLSDSFLTKPEWLAGVDGRPIIFTAGSIRPARGLEDVISAMRKLRDRGVEAVLVVAGEVSGDADRYRRRISEAIGSHGLGNSVIWPGSLSRPAMAWCFANCSAFVMTSRVEACPNTALEALTYGAPCIATTLRPMPETFGDAAFYYTAADSETLATQIARVLGLSSNEKALLADRARARASGFTWEATVQATVSELSLASNRR